MLPFFILFGSVYITIAPTAPRPITTMSNITTTVVCGDDDERTLVELRQGGLTTKKGLNNA